MDQSIRATVTAVKQQLDEKSENPQRDPLVSERAWRPAPWGADGLPRPAWDGRTGEIDRGVLEPGQQYDLRLVLQKNWPTVGPKLRGKLRIYVGEADEYYLNNAVHLLDDFLRKAKPPAEAKIIFAARQGHFWRALTEGQMMKEMGAVVERSETGR